MVLVKKLVFAPFFLIIFALLIYSLNPLFSSYDLIFNLSLNTLIQLLILSSLILLSSLLFVLFATLSFDWKLILPVGIIASALPLILTNPSLGLIITAGTLASLFLTYLILESSLKSYLTFQPSSILGPSIRHLSTLLILIICIVYFLSINKLVQQNGFQVPDSLIDAALKFAPQSEQPTKTQTLITESTLSQDQIDLLKQNPDLLRQYGLDPSILDNLGKTQTIQQTQSALSDDLIKKAVKDQLQDILEPYLGIIPAVLSVILFLTLQSLTSILNLLIYPLLWITFYILEKSEFVKFTTEQRPVKKMVI